MSRLRFTILVSGTGSNLQALIDARAEGQLHAELVHVISNRNGVAALQKAADAGIPCSVLEHAEFTQREDFDRALAKLTVSHEPDLILLAGFMRILGPGMLQPFDGRIINLHPSLLPRYRGTDTYRRAIEAGDAEHGASMHFVTAELDGGPVISQVRIPIEPDDSPADLATRLSPREHALVTATAEFFCQHPVECREGKILVDGIPLEKPLELFDDDTFSR